jgi:hypothetical protein
MQPAIRRSKMMRGSTLSLTVLFLLAGVSAWACCDATLPIGPGANTGILCSGHDVALGCGLDPNPVPTNHLDIFLNGESGVTNVDIARLIIGIPSTAGAFAPPDIDKVDVYATYPGSHTTDGTDRSATSWGSLTSGETNAYHECLGISGGGGTGNSFADWHAADLNIGVNSVSFALYYYNLSPLTNLNYGGLYDIFLKSGLPIGTIEIAYGCANGSCSNVCYYTPNQQDGQVVPEPASWLMVAGAGLALLGRLYKKSRS